MLIRVYHSRYGCDSGCCGHVVAIEGRGEQFIFDHPDEDHADIRAWALDRAREVVATRWPDCLKTLDWDHAEVTASRECQ